MKVYVCDIISQSSSWLVKVADKSRRANENTAFWVRCIFYESCVVCDLTKDVHLTVQ